MEISTFLELLFDKYKDEITDTYNLHIALNNPVRLNRLTNTSKEISKNSVFCALQGERNHGIDYIDSVEASGSVLTLFEKHSIDSRLLKKEIAYIKFKDLRKSLCDIAYSFYELSRKKLSVIAVTGTAGKSSTAIYIYRILKAYGFSAGIISGAEIRGQDYTAKCELTTPEATDIGYYLTKFNDEFIDVVVVECSSQAIAYRRVDLLIPMLKLAVLTNIGHDHLDYHGTYQAYSSVKIDFVNLARQSLVNSSDVNFSKYISSLNKQSLSFFSTSRRDIDYYLEEKSSLLYRTASPLFSFGKLKCWRHQKINFSMAIAAVDMFIRDSGLSCGKIDISNFNQLSERATTPLLAVDGRYWQHASRGGGKIVVDYAHTEEAVRESLLDCRALFPERKLVFLFGCGGDRDFYKRKSVGRASVELSEIVIVTSDNPRCENPEKIIAELLAAMVLAEERRATFIYVFPNRADAIKFTVGDFNNEHHLLLISGRGSEKYQIVGEQKLEFSDIDFVKDTVVLGKGGTEIHAS
jgi:UDP-N-acetylmuramoyl-L-alanyl-D-glutamate--2,6-diaminopimelate ligase